MSVTVKKAVLWRRELANRPGALSETLKPLSDAGVNLQVVMGYNYPGDPERSAVEVYPVSGAKAEKAAHQAGLAEATSISCLLVQGEDFPGLGHKISDSLATAGINISFVMVQVSGSKYLGIFGFESESDATNAIEIIKKAGAVRRGKGKRKSASKKSVSGKTKKTGKSKTKAKSAKKSAGKKTSGTASKGRKKSGSKKGKSKSASRKKK